VVVAITGHRPNKLGNDYDFTSKLVLDIKAEIQKTLKELKPTKLITGMALGVDTLFAQLAIENNIPFIAALPCYNQERMWPERSKMIYHRLGTHELCTIKYVTRAEYSTELMQVRNEWMVDHCDVLISVWDGSNGGTANCVKYAMKQLKAVNRVGNITKHIRINPEDFAY